MTVYDALAQPQRSFCPTGNLAQPCSTPGLTCTDDSADAAYHAAAPGQPQRFPWYQLAIYWAVLHAFRDVRMDPGVITINRASVIPGSPLWYTGDGIAIHVPSHVDLKGSADLSHPTVLKVSSTPSLPVRVSALVFVSSSPSGGGSLVADANVSYLTLVGTDQTGTDCTDAGRTMGSIADMDNVAPPLHNNIPLSSIYLSAGVVVNQTDPGGGNVNVHHVKVDHADSGIGLGWYNGLDTPSCQSTSCLRLTTTPKSADPCDVTVTNQSFAPGCVTNYCHVTHRPYQGSTGAFAKVNNNSICDVRAGIVGVVGNVDIYRNVILGRYDAKSVGANVDTHTPTNRALNFTENYVDGFEQGFATDGSPYVDFPPGMFLQVTGIDPATCVSFDNYLALVQYMFDDASRWYLSFDPYRDFGDHLVIRYNRLYHFSLRAVSLYRQQWAWVGYNVIRWSPGGVTLLNGINSWIYGNAFQDVTSKMIDIEANPRTQSLVGSCFNGVDVEYNEVGPSYAVVPNTYAGRGTPVTYGPHYCDAGIFDDGEGFTDAANYSTIRVADANGDGKAEVCARSDGGVECSTLSGSAIQLYLKGPAMSDASGWSYVEHYSTIRLADINGDGKADVCGRSAGGVDCYLSNGKEFTTYVAGPRWSDATGWLGAQYYSTIDFAGINGDHKADVCGRSAFGLDCYLSNGSGFPTYVAGPGWADSAGWGNAQYYSTIRFADINGDGKADVCARSAFSLDCYLSSGNGFPTYVPGPAWADSTGWGNPQYYSTIRLADINGDGKADACGRSAFGLDCFVSSGGAFPTYVMGPRWADSSGWGVPKYYATIRLGDVNGDGKADACARSAFSFDCYLSNGSAFPTAVGGVAWSDASGWGVPAFYDTIRLADVDADGKQEACARTAYGMACWDL